VRRTAAQCTHLRYGLTERGDAAIDTPDLELPSNTSPGLQIKHIWNLWGENMKKSGATACIVISMLTYPWLPDTKKNSRMEEHV
jgi:hypothetical protein